MGCRWDASAIDELPSYMKACFDAIYETTNEISSVVRREHGWDPIHFLIKEVLIILIFEKKKKKEID